MDNYSKKHPIGEAITEAIDDLESIVKQMVVKLQESSKGKQQQQDSETLAQLTELFEQKMQSINALYARVPNHVEREAHIRALEKCVESRNNVIEDVENQLKVIEEALIHVIHQGSKRVKAARLAARNPQMSEDLVRFASQISKSYAVAAPNFWQIGDPLRPYPTEIDFAKSKLAAPRVQPAAPALALLRSSSANAMGIPGLRPGMRNMSPMGSAMPGQPQFQNAGGMVPQRGQWTGSPGRGGYGTSSPRGGVRAMTPMGSQGMNPMVRSSSPQVLNARRMSGADRMSSPASQAMKQRAAPPPVNSVENMSSDSSSESSSDEAS
ncbi:hypothetical protein L596_011439 [Steinernema carpocapsae]|uniref:Mediator of RNA polymerase II transcription subunit 4 n=1 Tax=Steinernema carpocapsae TaxID=34508 RepID=A0A4U5NTX1_STECR|nr:hypothetical protein L596_011439 [Steinernema carpocapsae]